MPLLWREHLGEHFETFSGAFLEVQSTPVSSYPCGQCGCLHEIVFNENSDHLPSPATVYAVCRCTPWSCDTIELAAHDILPLRLSWSRLGRALCKALELEARPIEVHLPQTRQIGAWSAEAVPVLLTMLSDGSSLRHAIWELVARLGCPFILLGPTSNYVDALCRESLASAKAMFLPLDQNVRLEENGTLRPLRLPGELFAEFAPQPKDDLAEKDARRAFGLVKTLESEAGLRKARILTVFRLYCMENLSVAAIARKCSCSPPIIYRRLNTIRDRLGCDPASLRRYSAQFESIERSLTHSEAKGIYRKGVAFGEEDTEP